MDDREEVNRRAAEFVASLRKRLEDGKAEIDRQNRAIHETRDHIAEMRRWHDSEPSGS
ncbi:MAG TPA: hypothetical protein VHC67_11080 [Gaiellaceae bacterium]|jgi:hypothetical protein|nr:hypothetical protein [Gaiellaceae bacterium]